MFFLSATWTVYFAVFLLFFFVSAVVVYLVLFQHFEHFLKSVILTQMCAVKYIYNDNLIFLHLNSKGVFKVTRHTWSLILN